jgi:hypothetical protein
MKEYKFDLKDNGRAIETVTGSDEEGLYSESRVLLKIAPFTFIPSGESTNICKNMDSDDSLNSESISISCLSA